MKSIYALVAMFIGLFAVEALAADASKPDAASIFNATLVAAGVGNTDAAVSFFADDGYDILPSGRKVVGKDELRTMIAKIWIPENLQALSVREVKKTQDGHSVLYLDYSAEYLKSLGVASAQSFNIVDIEGNRIKSIVSYFPLSSLKKLTKACDAHPEFKTPSGMPCADLLAAFKKHTDNLIAQGIAEKD